MHGMQRQRSGGHGARRAPVARRWVAVDALDVSRIEPGSSVAPHSTPSITQGVARWRARIEWRRARAILVRSLVIGLGLACLLQVGALAAGRAGVGWWLVPAGLVSAACMAFALAHRTSDATAARMLDRDLALGAGVSTALELEQDEDPAGVPGTLRALAVADGRAALGRSFSGGRVRLEPRRRELAALALLLVALAALVLVPSSSTTRSASEVVRSSGHPGGRAASRPARTPVGPTLRDFRETPVHTPPLAQVASGSSSATASNPYTSGHSPYGGGIQNSSKAGAIQPVSHTVGPAGTKIDTRSTTAGSSSAEGATAQGKGNVGAQKDSGGTAGSASTKGAVQGLAPSGGDTARTDPAAGSRTGAQASSTGGSSRGGNGSSAAGSSPGGQSRQGTPGGATAGATKGASSTGAGVVPQLGAGTALPLQPGYEAVAGARGAPGEHASSTAGGGGGASHSGQATAGSATGGGAGVAFVPPAASSVTSSTRQLLLGYFGSFARVTASGW
jgi:hypothetical protein